jgi:N-acetyl-gamma-glutamyl-phosphate reductase
MGHTAAILGASGFTGGELLRLLAGHPTIRVEVATGASRAGDDLGTVHPHLAGYGPLEIAPLQAGLAAPVDICFSCLPHGELAGHASEVAARVAIDLSGDHRADAGWVYGLTEFAREDVAGATRVANPGCYPTATMLALVPFASRALIEAPVVVDAISGISGAGRSGADHLSFSVASAGFSAYGTTDHRHVPEIERGLARFGAMDAPISFTPHLAPAARGLLATARARLRSPMTDADALDVLRDAYEREPFVHVTEGWPSTKALTGTNRAQVTARVDARSGWLIASAAIDNLGKGAAGQALQNANVVLGLEETAGLEQLGVWP